MDLNMDVRLKTTEKLKDGEEGIKSDTFRNRVVRDLIYK